MTLELVPSSLPTAIILLWPFLMSHMNYYNGLLLGFQSLPNPTPLKRCPSFKIQI